MAVAWRTFLRRSREDLAFWALSALVIAAFLLGGGGRDDLLSLLVLRPLGSVLLVFGLYHLRAEHIRDFRMPFVFLGSVILLIALHLVPLPPQLWSALPGRDIAHEAALVAGIEQPWRPISLVPWRAWNALYAMQIPAAALVLAAICRPDQRASIVTLVLALGMLSVVVGILQAISGYRESLYLYAITNPQSPNGLFANRNHQAAMICTMLPLMAVFAGRGTRARHGVAGLRAWLAAGAGGAMFLVLLITGSRAGIVLGVVALGIVALIHRRGSRPAKGRSSLFDITLLGAGVVLIGLLAATFLNIGGLERMLEVDAEGETRLQSWPVILNLIGQYFPIGSGIGSFVEVYKLHEPPELLTSAYLNHAHNDFLEWTLEGGLPAAILILAAAAAWVRATGRAMRKMQRGQGEGLLALAGSAIILVVGLASLVDYPLRVPSLSVLAVLAAVWMVDSDTRAERRVGSNGVGMSPRTGQVAAQPH